jgi:glycosyltransferase involved in cell wall biosynthesis
MWIDVKIPYEPQNRLAEAYNRAIENSKGDWILLLDHDVLVSLNPLWYDICLEVIESLDENRVGLVTCRECIDVRSDGDLGRSIERCEQHAKLEYQKGLRLRRITRPEEVAGYFMIVNWYTWFEVRFRDVGKGVNKIDHDFARRLLEKNYELYMIEGLWVYHRRGVRKQRNDWKQ